MKAPEVSLVYYRAGEGCIECVCVVDNHAQVKKMSVLEALNTMADLATITARTEKLREESK